MEQSPVSISELMNTVNTAIQIIYLVGSSAVGLIVAFIKMHINQNNMAADIATLKADAKRNEQVMAQLDKAISMLSLTVEHLGKIVERLDSSR